MKSFCNAFAVLMAALCTASTAAALPLVWRADWPDAKPVETLVHRGTDIELQPQWFINKEPADTNGWTFTTFCQTNAVGPWFGPLPGAFFSHTNDVGAAFYNVMVRASTPGGAVNYTAFARLRMLDSPGFAPGELPLPVPFIDFSKCVALHAPWTLQTDFSAATNTLSATIGGLAQNLATNYFTAAETKARTDEAKAIGGYALETAERALDTTATINSKIPSAASASNQLADKEWTEGQLKGKIDKSGGIADDLLICGTNEAIKFDDDLLLIFRKINGAWVAQNVWDIRTSQDGVVAFLSDIYDAVQQIAPAFMAKTYAANDLCTYNGVVYRCKMGYTATASSAKPDADTTHWEAKPVSELFLPLTGGTATGVVTAKRFEVPNGTEGGLRLHYSNYNATIYYHGGVGVHIGVKQGSSGTYYIYFQDKGGTLALTAGTGHTGNLAALDASGNPVDSGIPKTSVAMKPANFTPGNLASFDMDGNLTDSGYRLEVRNGIPYIVETTNN